MKILWTTTADERTLQGATGRALVDWRMRQGAPTTQYLSIRIEEARIQASLVRNLAQDEIQGLQPFDFSRYENIDGE